MTTKEFEQKIKRVLITEEEIQAKVREVGAQISREYEGKPLLLVSIRLYGRPVPCHHHSL